MKIFYNTNFDGHWPVGVSAVVIASPTARAEELLNDELVKIGLKPTAMAEDFVKIPSNKESVHILQDGSY